MGTQKCGWMDGWMGYMGWMDGMDGEMDGRDGWTGCVDGGVDERRGGTMEGWRDGRRE